jgi:hypothetical protein
MAACQYVVICSPSEYLLPYELKHGNPSRGNGVRARTQHHDVTCVTGMALAMTDCLCLAVLVHCLPHMTLSCMTLHFCERDTP